MNTSRIQIGAKVFNKKNQEGQITRIITKSTGYVEVTYLNGTKKNEMAFNLTGEDGQPLKSAHKKATPRTLSTAERIQRQKEMLLNLREDWADSTTRLIADVLNKAVIEDSFIQSLKDAWFDAYVKGWSYSEKRAYYLAKYMIENNLGLI